MPRHKKPLVLEEGEKDKIIQLPFRCSRATELRILKARGNHMVITGQNVTGNAFMLMLIEEGLKKFEG